MATTSQQALDAEKLFDEINFSYKVAFRDNPTLQKVFQEALEDPGNARASILDVGCGTGGPVSSTLVAAGHDVTDIDVWQVMNGLCGKNIREKFLKADTTTFEPEKRFDAIFAIFSLLQMPYRTVYSTIFKFASWLKPGGTLILGTVPSDDLVVDKRLLDTSGEFIDGIDVRFMDDMIKCTFGTPNGWKRLVEAVGFEIMRMEHSSFKAKVPASYSQQHLFLTCMLGAKNSLMGPYPLPSTYCLPFMLSDEAWRPFQERLTRFEFEAVMKAVEDNVEILDVGSGYGDLPKAIAQKLGKSYAIEPNPDRMQVIENRNTDLGVQIKQGRAEALPYSDDSFDAVVAMWILHYVSDVEKALEEMVRVANRKAANARIVIVRGAPDNELVNLINNICAPIAALDAKENYVSHQGFLLTTATRIFSKNGFGDISLERVHAHCNFPETDFTLRCSKAAEILSEFWYRDHPRLEQMRTALLPALEKHFEDSPFKIGDQAVMLVAKPTPSLDLVTV
ncbi:S-adenosyl-L-methionine-dependent methyltransferase [Glarea lozoyensis ATCC 20868]|uniref:S-adenosyl-L-methionine-dependent methyltransferase n=1 Tax=Glarea lozoyensis (strain ATCC 20868 / MF5171) TaxID=1116229 RepID=S3DJ27_GLAL2|nr:S-adenosyl-L-methionine-dependent methyltransferase [Glarea lozoyensis ATCC 20868]EPE26553.1 S-adenosyl-L-methionine-dependent methyltransferase [Glarea lozoyensis ATCC 20868]